jgi:FkbM family methyltransferase
MKLADSWPAYHGWGGSFELDTLKFVDALVICNDGEYCPEKPFDLVFDLGANTGYYTEKLTVRNFAQNYILVEANPHTSQVLLDRWGNLDWKQAWFTQQVPLKGSQFPEFEIITKPLSNHSNGVLDMCMTEESMGDTESGCKVPIASVDDLIPAQLSPAFQDVFQKAQSAFIKIDTEGMDELVIRGMKRLLQETRGVYEDTSPRYLVNFLQFEFSPVLMKIAKEREGFHQYDIKSVTKYLESNGFESFLIGPRFLPLSHGSWHDEFRTWTEDPNNNAGTRLNYPEFDDRVCAWCQTMDKPSFTADVVAIRSSHPRATELKIALGACQESKDFDIRDTQYEFPQ